MKDTLDHQTSTSITGFDGSIHFSLPCEKSEKRMDSVGCSVCNEEGFVF